MCSTPEPPFTIQLLIYHPSVLISVSLWCVLWLIEIRRRSSEFCQFSAWSSTTWSTTQVFSTQCTATGTVLQYVELSYIQMDYVSAHLEKMPPCFLMQILSFLVDFQSLCPIRNRNEYSRTKKQNVLLYLYCVSALPDKTKTNVKQLTTSFNIFSGPRYLDHHISLSELLRPY